MLGHTPCAAKEFIGNKAKMTHDQTTFAASVADLGLQRGIEGSKARHTRIQAFYELVERLNARVACLAALDAPLQPQIRYRGRKRGLVVCHLRLVADELFGCARGMTQH